VPSITPFWSREVVNFGVAAEKKRLLNPLIYKEKYGNVHIERGRGA